jgi:cell wall-associated NlpC family hydrolase
MDPQGAARLFYQALLAVSGWQQLPLTQAAQAVQNSGLPFEYAKWEDEARQVVGAVHGVVCPPTAPGSATAPNGPMVQTVIDRALATVGTPYVWGGGDADGPTRGVQTPAGRIPQGVGFDCSGLMLHAYAGIGVDVPHQTRAIWARFGPPITDRDALLPGDMILLSNNGRPDGIHHVGLYLGDARVVHAPRTNTPVTVVDNMWASSYWSGEFIGAVRAVPAAPPTTTTSPLLRAA